MIASVPAQVEITLSKARAIYERVTNVIRERHDPPVYSSAQPQAWDIATAHVVMGLMDWEATAVLRYLISQPGLAMPDVALAEALAARLGLTITFGPRKELVE